MCGIVLDPLHAFLVIFTTAVHVNTLIPHFTVEETISKRGQMICLEYQLIKKWYQDSNKLSNELVIFPLYLKDHLSHDPVFI